MNGFVKALISMYFEFIVFVKKLHLPFESIKERGEMKHIVILGFWVSMMICFIPEKVFPQKIDSLLTVLPESRGTQLADVLNNLAWELKYSDIEKAFVFADSALKISSEKNYNEGMTYAYRNIGTLYFLIGNFEKAVENFRKTIEIADRYGYEFHKAKAMNVLAIIHRDRKNYEDALITFNQALEIFRKLNNREEINGVDHNIASLYSEIDEHALALEIYLEVLQNETESVNLYGIARSASNLGYEYDFIDSTQKAIYYFNLSIENSREINNKNFEASALHGLTSVYIQSHNLIKAKECIYPAITINRELSNLPWLANNFIQMVKILRLERKYENAECYLDSAIYYYDKTGLIEEKFAALVEKADLYFFQNNLVKAEKLLKDALSFREEKQLKTSLKDLSSLFYRIYKNQKKYESAFIWLEKYTEVIKEENLLEKEKAVLIVLTLNGVQQVKQENEYLKKENRLNEKIIFTQKILFTISAVFLVIFAIIIFLLIRSGNKIKLINRSLEQKNREIETKSTQLAEANATKDKFFSIIAHDLRNPFNALLGLSDLIVEEAKAKKDAEIAEYAQKLSETSQNTYDLLENLLEWSRSQRGAIQLEIAEMKLLEVVNNVTNSLVGNINHKELKIYLNIDPAFTIKTDERLLQVILRNLIGNAIKFSYRQGKISIRSASNNGSEKISISDEGVGMDKETVSRLFRIDQQVSTPGTENERGSGLGLVLCSEFVEKLGGKIWVESEKNKGSDFHITFSAR